MGTVLALAFHDLRVLNLFLILQPSYLQPVDAVDIKLCFTNLFSCPHL